MGTTKGGRDENWGVNESYTNLSASRWMCECVRERVCVSKVTAQNHLYGEKAEGGMEYKGRRGGKDLKHIKGLIHPNYKKGIFSYLALGV